MINLGDKVKDTITGFEGVAIAKVKYLNNCVQYEVQPEGLKEGTIIKSVWIDEGQLVVKKGAKIKKDKEKPPGGSGHVPSGLNHPTD